MKAMEISRSGLDVEWRRLDCSDALGGDAKARCARVFVVAASADATVGQGHGAMRV
jgi:hypothetical protein